MRLPAVPLVQILFLGFVASTDQPGLAAEAPRFVGSQVCGTCHVAQANAWADSHHAGALRLPTPATVLGDFGNARFEHKGVTSRFFRRDGRYFVETDGADGRPAVFEIGYVVGVAPLQQYLVTLDRGRLQALDIAWDTERRQWFHLYPNEDLSAGNGLHWTGFYKNWQARCATCHQTDFRKNYDQATRSYQSAWSELAVGCEACHGPGEAHVAWARQGADLNGKSYADLTSNGLLPALAVDKQAIEENMCGPCHARRDPIGPDSTLPGRMFGDHYNLATLGDGLYFADGQQDQEVYVLGSFLQSKMRQKGVSCGNCHDPHSGRLVAEGNAVCTQCHNEAGRQEFPTLARKDYDSAAHHRHPPRSAGANCVNCHMPERAYMTVDGRRDHFFRIPDPLTSEKVGSPDACLSCHTGQKAAWAAVAIDQWNPNRPRPASDPAELFHSVRTEGLDEQRLKKLADLAQDASKSDIVRASALREMGEQADPTTLQLLAGVLSDDSDLVRSTAVRLWRRASPAERVSFLEPLLSDPVRSVRIAAALELSNIAPEQLAPNRRDALQTALGELKAAMTAKADFPEGQMAIGGLAMATRNWVAAEAAFAEATFMDPQLAQAWSARARIAEALGDPAEAIAILSAAREKNPDHAAIATQMANLLIQQGRPAEAVLVLGEVASADPANQDVRFALALALLNIGDLSAAAAEVEFLRTAAPDRAEVLMLYGLLQVASNDLAGARETVREVKERYPDVRLPPPLDALTRVP